MNSHVTFPNESREYRESRDALLQAERALRAQVEEVAALRRKLPMGGKVPQDYEFERLRGDGSVGKVRMSELFADGKDTLVVYSMMYGPKMETACPSCTSLVDGFDASFPHVSQRVNFVVVARNPVERVAALASKRGWSKVPLLSSAGNSFNADYHAENQEGEQNPMAHVFVKRGDGIHHFWSSELVYAPRDGGDPRAVDQIWPLWNILDLTPDGRGDFSPALVY